MKKLHSVFVSIPLLFSFVALTSLQSNNKLSFRSFLNKQYACENKVMSGKPGILLRCEGGDKQVYEYAIREEKITMIGDVAGYGTSEPIQFNVALPDSRVVNLGDNNPAVVYISIQGNYDFASDVKWNYISSYTENATNKDDTEIRRKINIVQSAFSKKVRKITISKTGDKKGVITLSFYVEVKKSE